MTENALRADARANRERIVQAARELYAEQGPRASLNAIAHRAGVGNATLYRHFHDASQLRDAIFADRLDELLDCLHRAGAQEDPFEALGSYLAWLITTADLSTVGLVHDDSLHSAGVIERMQRVRATLSDLVARGRELRRVRPDLAVEDVNAISHALVGVARNPALTTEDGTRLLRIVIDGLRP